MSFMFCQLTSHPLCQILTLTLMSREGDVKLVGEEITGNKRKYRKANFASLDHPFKSISTIIGNAEMERPFLSWTYADAMIIIFDV